MTTCLKYLLPMSCALFLAAVIYPLALVQMTGGRSQIVPRPAYKADPHAAALETATPSKTAVAGKVAMTEHAEEDSK